MNIYEGKNFNKTREEQKSIHQAFSKSRKNADTGRTYLKNPL